MGRGTGKAGAVLAGVPAGVGATAGLIWISYLLARGRVVFGGERAEPWRRTARPAPRSLHGPGHRGPRWHERECGELRICDEFLQQCEQAELPPDQRWVQLISLTRPGLEVEPMWWDRLRASTIVAPGAAAVELGLQVARAVVS